MTFQQSIDAHPNLYATSIVLATTVGALSCKSLMLFWHWSLWFTGPLFLIMVVIFTYGFTFSSLKIHKRMDRFLAERKMDQLKASGKFIP